MKKRVVIVTALLFVLSTALVLIDRAPVDAQEQQLVRIFGGISTGASELNETDQYRAAHPDDFRGGCCNLAELVAKQRVRAGHLRGRQELRRFVGCPVRLQHEDGRLLRDELDHLWGYVQPALHRAGHVHLHGRGEDRRPDSQDHGEDPRRSGQALLRTFDQLGIVSLPRGSPLHRGGLR